jgi:hypothetical protein
LHNLFHFRASLLQEFEAFFKGSVRCEVLRVDVEVDC